MNHSKDCHHQAGRPRHHHRGRTLATIRRRGGGIANGGLGARGGLGAPVGGDRGRLQRARRDLVRLLHFAAQEVARVARDLPGVNVLDVVAVVGIKSRLTWGLCDLT